MQDAKTTRLFVYGTLRPNLVHHSIGECVRQFLFLAHGRSRGRLYDLGEYPGAIFDDAATTEVRGDVFTLPDVRWIWQALDDYEGVPTLFVRVRRSVTLDDDTAVDCWAYAYHQPVDAAKLIFTGRYGR